MVSMESVSCFCDEKLMLQACCGRYHQGENAPTPEALMRSRYSAFALGLSDYLLATWHSSTRPEVLTFDPATEWKRLTILSAAPPLAYSGQVHFRAFFCEPKSAQGRKRWHVLEEVSRFVKENQRWWYVDGSPTLIRLKPRQNEPCLCGSGRKLKQCCG